MRFIYLKYLLFSFRRHTTIILPSQWSFSSKHRSSFCRHLVWYSCTERNITRKKIAPTKVGIVFQKAKLWFHQCEISYAIGATKGHKKTSVNMFTIHSLFIQLFSLMLLENMSVVIYFTIYLLIVLQPYLTSWFYLNNTSRRQMVTI